MPSSAAPILITGGAQRIGLHCALRLLESGQPVIVSYHSEREGLAELRERGATTLAADFASEAGLSMCFAPIINVNGIRPALIQLNPDDSAEYRTKRLAESALGIEPGAEVIYQSLRYLLDNPYVTGTTLTVNGGRHLV